MPYLQEGKFSPSQLNFSKSPVLIMVHGTGSSTGADLEADSGPGWWQPQSDFDNLLCSRLLGSTDALDLSRNILRFVWSGENSERAREKAAESLCSITSGIEEAGLSLSVIAHSHGGNVVRRACELAVMRGRRNDLPPWRVVCMGTPFFHYSVFGALIAALFSTVLLGLWVAAVYWLAPWLANRLSTTWLGEWGVDWYYISIGAGALYHLYICANKWSNIQLRRHLKLPNFRAHARFTNLVAGRDEAVGLLKSFNRPIRLVRRLDPAGWIAGPFGCSLLALIGTMLVGVVIVAISMMMGKGDGSDLLVLLMYVVVLFVAAVIVTMIIPVFHWVADLFFTGVLRKLAYGNDSGAPMTAVETYPWSDADSVTKFLDDGIEAAISDKIKTGSGGLWAKMHGAMEPHTPLLSQDIRKVTEAALTGDELAHNVCYRVPSFVDLVAEQLNDTGPWERASASPRTASAEAR